MLSLNAGFLFLLLALPSPLATVLSSGTTTGGGKNNVLPLKRIGMPLWRKRFQSKRVSKQVNKQSSSSRRRKGRGTLFTLRRPTVERVSQWFSGTEQALGQPLSFNHDSVGMTNPSLQIGSSDATDCSIRKEGGGGAVALGVEDAWWPVTPIESSGAGSSWRILRHRRRVGRGLACYQAVRDAALQWEFAGPEEERGMLRVIPGCSDQQPNDNNDAPPPLSLYPPVPRRATNRRHFVQQSQDDGAAQSADSLLENDVYAPSQSNQVMQIWAGPGRRLVTYASSGLLKVRWLPKLYVVNPVSVVYDLVDQSGPKMTTFSSTAYATQKG